MRADEVDGLPRDTPAEVVRYAAGPGRTPPGDPALGTRVERTRRGTPRHWLVAIGDSLTHGFQSGAVCTTDLSYPAVIAHELGWEGFRSPQYPAHGGLPLNLELLLRDLEQRFGADLDLWEVPLALFRAHDLLDEIEDHWERGPGRDPAPAGRPLQHALAVYGWNLHDALTRTAGTCAAELAEPRDDVLRQVVQSHAQRAALRVYPGDPASAGKTFFDVARELGAEHDEDTDAGIETLVVMLGSNNALRTVCDLRLRWTGEDGAPPVDEDACTMWAPSRFGRDLERVAEQVGSIEARHVVWSTVPHVTIAPLARGLGTKVAPGSRCFPHYARPWTSPQRFDPQRHRHLTAAQVRAVDHGVDMFNERIEQVVERGRRGGCDWYLFDLCTLLDRLASRRYVEDPDARPPWWSPYPLPAELARLDPPPDTRFLSGDGRGGRATGGLFSLDGVHPTTVGYGLIAQGIVDVMRLAGVEFHRPDGSVRPDPVTVDFARLLRRDTLVTHPPQLVPPALGALEWADTALDAFRRALPL
ncbi:hypothetical protein [Kineococcus gypseus]|uniref:hypothetical protein n=1 Tax=Kineococcus gypseus TaxID=1637102 RepID=UPI003D7D2F9E